jgi:hypothetical protein
MADRSEERETSQRNSPSERFWAAAEAALRYLDDSKLETLSFTLEPHLITILRGQFISRRVH